MATYYWVGGAGTWDNSATTNWASSSGGAGGAGVPTSADDVFVDTSSGTGTVNLQPTAVCNNLTVTSTQALSIGTFAYHTLTVYGNLSISSSTYNPIFEQTPFKFAATTTGKTINVGGKLLNSYTFDGVGGGWTLLSNITSGSNICRFTNGTLNTAGYELSFGGVWYSATGTFNLTLGTSTISGIQYNPGWDFSSTTGLTFSGASSTIILNGISSFGVTGFNGGGLTYGNLVFNNTAPVAIFSITGANTFTGTVSKTTAERCTITLPSSVTTTVANWTVSGSLGNLVTLNSSTAGTRATLNKSVTGAVTSINYLSVKDISGSPSNIWFVGKDSTNGGNNLTVYFLNMFGLSVSENVTVLDSTTQITPVFVIESIDSIADIESTATTFALAVAENLVVYDASTTAASFVANASEPTTLVDYLVGGNAYSINVVENLALNDAETSVRIHNATAVEPISVLDVTNCFGWGTIDNIQSTTWTLIDNRQ
jgi:hypothetical protein